MYYESKQQTKKVQIRLRSYSSYNKASNIEQYNLRYYTICKQKRYISNGVASQATISLEILNRRTIDIIQSIQQKQRCKSDSVAAQADLHY